MTINADEAMRKQKLFPLLSWASQRCASTTAATFFTSAKTATQVVNAVLSRLPALEYMALLPLADDQPDPFKGALVGSACALQLCPNLTQVYLSMFALYQGHLDSLAALKHLQVVAIQGQCQADGDFSSLKGHKNFPGQLAHVSTLRVLYIDSPRGGIPAVCESISRLTQLEELHLIRCQVLHLPDGLLNLSRLFALHIRNAKPRADDLVCPDLSLLPELQNLALAHCFCEVPAGLLQCSQLTSLSLEGTGSAPLPVAPYLSNLQEVALDNHGLSLPVLRATCQLQRLHCLGTPLHIFQQENIDLKEFACSLPKLQQMCVCNVDDSYLNGVHLNRCMQLNQLLIAQCSIPEGHMAVHIGRDNTHVLGLPWVTNNLHDLASRFWDKV